MASLRNPRKIIQLAKFNYVSFGFIVLQSVLPVYFIGAGPYGAYIGALALVGIFESTFVARTGDVQISLLTSGRIAESKAIAARELWISSCIAATVFLFLFFLRTEGLGIYSILLLCIPIQHQYSFLRAKFFVADEMIWLSKLEAIYSGILLTALMVFGVVYGAVGLACAYTFSQLCKIMLYRSVAESFLPTKNVQKVVHEGPQVGLPQIFRQLAMNTYLNLDVILLSTVVTNESVAAYKIHKVFVSGAQKAVFPLWRSQNKVILNFARTLSTDDARSLGRTAFWVVVIQLALMVTIAGALRILDVGAWLGVGIDLYAFFVLSLASILYSGILGWTQVFALLSHLKWQFVLAHCLGIFALWLGPWRDGLQGAAAASLIGTASVSLVIIVFIVREIFKGTR